MKHPSYCCQKCGEQIGWLGRLLWFIHKCKRGGEAVNHIADANKMVSDTPRTEAEVNRQKCWSDDLVTIDANFACQLERELNAANDRIKSLIEERDRANRLAEWKWNLRDEFQLLLGTDKIEEGIEVVKEMKRRIKRLENAGDELLMWLGEDISESNGQLLQDAWHKAKEAKP